MKIPCMYIHCTCTCTYACVGLDTHVHALVSLLDWIPDRIPSWMATCLIMHLTQRLQGIRKRNETRRDTDGL